MDITPPDAADLYLKAVVIAKEALSVDVVRLRLRPEKDLEYHPGQFLNLRREDGLVRSYSLAGVPQLDPYLELQVKRMHNGRMSNWIHDKLDVGRALDVQGPNGESFYVPGRCGGVRRSSGPAWLARVYLCRTTHGAHGEKKGLSCRRESVRYLCRSVRGRRPAPDAARLARIKFGTAARW